MGNQEGYNDDELFSFKGDDSREEVSENSVPWKVLLVDDEEDVHEVTKIVFQGISFQGRSLQFISATSGKHARHILQQKEDIAVIFLDVVMEENDSGLKLISFIREELQNKRVRIIIRTGQAGYAPENDVVHHYDINGYCDKSGASSQSIASLLITSLRAYAECCAYEKGELSETKGELELLERVEEEVRIRIAQQKLLLQQSKMATMGEMLSVIMHQWHQPLNSIALLAQGLREMYPKESKEGKAVREAGFQIMEQTSFMAETTRTFKAFLSPSKKRVLFDMVHNVKSVVNLLTPLMNERGIFLFITHVDDILLVEGYPNEFKQVMLNILINACDAVSEKALREPETWRGEISLSLSADIGVVSIEIQDNAGGIPEGLKDEIFKNYYSTKGEKGTGLGLYISRVVVEENMSGSLNVENRNGGACFSVSLPRCHGEFL